MAPKTKEEPLPASTPKPKTERRYPLRQKALTKTYTEPTIVNPDDMLFCDECDVDYEIPCEIHPYLLLKDNQVTREAGNRDQSVETTPWPLSICDSKVKEAGRGVWTNAHLPKGLIFGPYGGHILCNVSPSEASGYGWRIRNRKYPNLCIDALDSSVSNWLRFVNCSRYL